MIQVHLSAEDMRKLLIWGYVDVDQIRITLSHGAANKAVELADAVRSNLSKKARLGNA